ncbi:MAG: flavodoxin family protein [Spirochaetales bacterium]|nr:flavodoxin family protein [Spirochaetales bacterium]
MKIITILGSPRRKGNTAFILTQFEELIRKHHMLERINLPSSSINGCRGCDVCQQKEDEPGCTLEDTISVIIAQILSADLIVYATPVYVWDFSAQLKTLFDRHYCLVKWKNRETGHSLMEKKKTLLLATCGGSREENADIIQEIFNREMTYLQCQIVGKYIMPNCTLPVNPGDKARELAQDMVRDVLDSSTAD